MKKKLFSLMMAMAMIAALAVPSFAGTVASTSVSGTGSQSSTIPLTGATALPAVKVTFPNGGKVILNPYKMTVANTGDSTAVASGNSTIDDQVLSASHEIKNETQAPMKVGIKITATPSTGVELATKACTGKETTKSVFMFAELMYHGTSQASSVSDITSKWTAPADVNDKCYPQIIASAEEKENASFFTVPAAAANGANYLYWTIRGNAATAPAEKWTAADKVDASVVFTFTPDVLTKIHLITSSDDNTVTDDIGVLEVGKDTGNNVLGTALTVDDDLCTAMGTVVRIVPATGSKTNGVISSVEVKDSTGAKVTATKVNANLYYFVATASSNPVTVKISGTAATNNS